MNIIAVTGASGSGKTFFSKQLAKNLENSNAINLDHVFFDILNTDENIISKIIQIYGKDVYDRSGFFNISKLQNIDNFNFDDFFNIVKVKLNEKIIQIIDENKSNKVDNLIIEWFVLPKTIAFEKCDFSVLVSPDEEDRENNLMQRDERDTPEKIRKRTQDTNINYEDYKYNIISKNTYKDGCFIKDIEYIKNRVAEKETKTNVANKIELNKRVIANNNEIINNNFAEIIELMKKNNISSFNENGELNPAIKEILNEELKKCIAIYCMEYGFEYPDTQINLTEKRDSDGNIDTKEELDARVGVEGMIVYPGTQRFIKNILNKVFQDKSVKENGLITEIDGCSINNTKSQLYSSSNRDQIDYFAEIINEGKTDLDFILDVLPHEAMHIFYPGDGFFIEGATERLTREAADKYNLRMTPTSHSRESIIMAKLKALLGQEAILSFALNNSQRQEYKAIKRLQKSKQDFNTKRFSKFKAAFDEKFGSLYRFDLFEKGLSSDYNKFLSNKKDIRGFGNWYRKSAYANQESFLDLQCKNNEKLVLSKNSAVTQNEILRVHNIQNNEIQMLEKLKNNLIEQLKSRKEQDESIEK